MSEKQKSYGEMSYNELLFLMIHHLMQQNYHQSIVEFHKEKAIIIQNVLNEMDSKE